MYKVLSALGLGVTLTLAAARVHDYVSNPPPPSAEAAKLIRLLREPGWERVTAQAFAHGAGLANPRLNLAVTDGDCLLYGARAYTGCAHSALVVNWTPLPAFSSRDQLWVHRALVAACREADVATLAAALSPPAGPEAPPARGTLARSPK